MQFIDLDDEESDEYGGRPTALDWAQERPVVAVLMVAAAWLSLIVVLNAIYGLLLA
jgi:hypothetical protein